MANRFLSLAGWPRRAAALAVTGAERLQQLVELTRRTLRTSQRAVKQTTSLERHVRDVRGEVVALREEVHERLLQYHLQLGRLARQVGGNGHAEGDAPLSWRSVPLAVDEGAVAWDAVAPAAFGEDDDWLILDACPVCGHDARTVVNEYNKLIMLTRAPDRTSARYDYAMCHACGVVYAARRPTGERYRFLLTHFGEVTAKGEGITNPLLNPSSLTDTDREELRRRAAPGVWVSDHLRLPQRDYLEGLLKDRFENSVHLDLLGSLAPPRGARVLEIRPRAGTISEGLRRLFGADVSAMPIWESQQFLLREVYGINTAGLIDYDDFRIPFDGAFDLIVCNHMLTHVVQPARFFAELRCHLKPGGHLYLYNEPEDREFLTGRQSMFATLNPLHMQTFDQASFLRGLAANGFTVEFVTRRRWDLMCLARLDPAAVMTPMREPRRAARIRAYTRARDSAVLRLPEELRPRFAGEWPRIVERAVADGLVEFDDQGRLRFLAGRA